MCRLASPAGARCAGRRGRDGVPAGTPRLAARRRSRGNVRVAPRGGSERPTIRAAVAADLVPLGRLEDDTDEIRVDHQPITWAPSDRTMEQRSRNGRRTCRPTGPCGLDGSSALPADGSVASPLSPRGPLRGQAGHPTSLRSGSPGSGRTSTAGTRPCAPARPSGRAEQRPPPGLSSSRRGAACGRGRGSRRPAPVAPAPRCAAGPSPGCSSAAGGRPRAAGLPRR